MAKKKHPIKRYCKELRKDYKRQVRMVFASPAEVRFIRHMGGVVIDWPLYHWRSKYPAITTLWRGWTLTLNGIHREVKVNGYYVDFGNPKRKLAIEIDGHSYHQNRRADAARDRHLKAAGWKILRLPASMVYNNPAEMRAATRRFLRH